MFLGKTCYSVLSLNLYRWWHKFFQKETDSLPSVGCSRTSMSPKLSSFDSRLLMHFRCKLRVEDLRTKARSCGRCPRMIRSQVLACSDWAACKAGFRFKTVPDFMCASRNLLFYRLLSPGILFWWLMFSKLMIFDSRSLIQFRCDRCWRVCRSR